MMYSFREYTPEDFLSLRDFMVQAYKNLGKIFTFTVERWNFSYSLDRIMNGASLSEWSKRIGIWEHEGRIIAAVSPEGEGNNGYFHLSSLDLPDSLLAEMVSFLQDRLARVDGKMRIFIPEGFDRLEALAAAAGFVKQKWQEPESAIELTKRPSSELPPGFSFKCGLELSAKDTSLAHAKAFGYIDNEEYVKRSYAGYQLMRKTPDYRGDLDLYVISPSQEIASFATIWYDKDNQIGILEPVGTHPDYRRMGLGRAVIGQGLQLIAKEGATKAYVGSAQPFYLSIGFQVCGRRNVWEKACE